MKEIDNAFILYIYIHQKERKKYMKLGKHAFEI